MPRKRNSGSSRKVFGKDSSKSSRSLAEKLNAANIVLNEWKPRPEILLCPNTPKPMHGVVPREILGRMWWEQTRYAAFQSTNFHCLACGVSKWDAKYHKWLEGHELYKVDYYRGRLTYLETVPLCHYCHNFIHDGRLRNLLEQGKLHHAKYVAIIQHGDQVLASAGLNRPSFLERELELARRKVARWDRWRLVLFDQLYPPKFRDEQSWLEAHQYA